MGWAAAGAAAGSIIGSAGTAISNWKLQQDAQKHQIRMYKRRYQWTMDDMREAGLNPILAYSQGPGSAGSTPMASVPDFGASLSRGLEAGANVAKKSSEKSKVDQEKENVILGRELLREQIQTTAQQGLEYKTRSGYNIENTRLTSANATKAERLVPIYDEAGNLIEKGTESIRDLYERLSPEAGSSAKDKKSLWERVSEDYENRPKSHRVPRNDKQRRPRRPR